MVVLLSGATFMSAEALHLVMRMAAVVPIFLKQIAAMVAQALMSTVAATAVVGREWAAAEEGGAETVRAVRAAAVAEIIVTQIGSVAPTVMSAVVAATAVGA